MPWSVTLEPPPGVPMPQTVPFQKKIWAKPGWMLTPLMMKVLVPVFMTWTCLPAVAVLGLGRTRVWPPVSWVMVKAVQTSTVALLAPMLPPVGRSAIGQAALRVEPLLRKLPVELISWDTLERLSTARSIPAAEFWTWKVVALLAPLRITPLEPLWIRVLLVPLADPIVMGVEPALLPPMLTFWMLAPLVLPIWIVPAIPALPMLTPELVVSTLNRVWLARF